MAVEYILIGQDGKEYGPYGLEMLRQWRDEGSLTRQTQLKNFVTGQIMEARAVPELFEPMASAAQIQMGRVVESDEGPGVLLHAIFSSVLGLLLFFVLNGLGLIVCGIAVFRAFTAKQEGSKWGTAALLITGISFTVIGVGWLLRLNGR